MGPHRGGAQAFAEVGPGSARRWAGFRGACIDPHMHTVAARQKEK